MKTTIALDVHRLNSLDTGQFGCRILGIKKYLWHMSKRGIALRSDFTLFSDFFCHTDTPSHTHTVRCLYEELVDNSLKPLTIKATRDYSLSNSYPYRDLNPILTRTLK